MAADIVDKQIGLGMSLGQLKQILGEPDGGYYNDGYWTYRIIRKDSEPNPESWSLVFALPYPEERVNKIFIWRECCNEPPAWMR